MAQAGISGTGVISALGQNLDETLSALAEGRFKAYAHRPHNIVNIVRGKVHDETLLLYLAEVKQLVDKFQQPVSITVYDTQIV